MKIKNTNGKMVNVPPHLEDQVRDHIKNNRHEEIQDMLDQNGVDLDDIKPIRTNYRRGGVIKYEGGGGVGPYFSNGYANDTGPRMENGAFGTNGNVNGTTRGQGINAGQVAGYATSAINLGTNIANINDKRNSQSKGDKAAASTNAVADLAGNIIAPAWYGAAKTGEAMGQSLFTNKNSNGDYASPRDESAAMAMTPVHEQVLNDASHGKWGDAVATGLTGGIYDDFKPFFAAQGGTVPSSPMFTTGQGTTFQDPYRNQGFGYNPYMNNQYNQPRLYDQGGNVNKQIIDVEEGELLTNKGVIQKRFKYHGMAPHNTNGTDVPANFVYAKPANELGEDGDYVIPKNQAKQYIAMGRNDRLIREKTLALNQATRERKEQAKYGIPKAEEGIKVGGPRANPYYNFNNPNNQYQEPVDMMAQYINNQVGPYSNNMFRGNTGPYMENGRFSTQGTQPYVSANNSVQNPGGFFDPNNLSGLSNAGASAVDPKLASRTRNPNGYTTQDYIGMGISALPAAYNLARGIIDKPRLLNASNYTNNQPVIAGKRNRRDDFSKLRDMSALAKYGINRSGNMSLGSYTNAISDLHNNYSNALANADNMDLQMKMQTDQFNSQTRDRNGQIRMGADQYNNKSRDNKENQISLGIGQIPQAYYDYEQNRAMKKYFYGRKGGRV